MKLDKGPFRNILLVPSLTLVASNVMAQPPIAVPVKPTNGEPETRQPMAPPMSLAELEKFIGGRTTLTLKLQDATLEEVAAAMSQSSGLDIAVRPTDISFRTMPPLIPSDKPDVPLPTYTPPPPPRFTLEAKEQPFWEALFAWRTVARAADMAALKAMGATPPVVAPNGRSARQFPMRTPIVSVESQRGGEGLWVSPYGGLPSGRLFSTWPVVMLATGIQRSQNGQFDPDPFMRQNTAPSAPTNAPAGTAGQIRALDEDAITWSDRLSISLTPFIDPKIKRQGLQCEVEEAIDDRGNDLRQSQSNLVRRGNASFSVAPYRFGSSLSINLEPHPAMGKQLKKLRGVLHFVIPVRHEKWEISDVKTPTQRTVWQNGSLSRMQFSGLEKSDSGWTAKFVVEAQGEAAIQLSGNRTRILAGPYTSASTSTSTSNGLPTQDFGLQSMSLVDDRGRTFLASDTGTGTSIRFEGRIEAPKPSISPPTPRVEKYAYRAEQAVTFSAGPDAAGKPFIGATNAAGAEIGMPVKLIINIPLEKREVSVPFEFTDLPLPPP